MQSPQWGTLEKVMNELKEKWQSDSVVMDTEWDTLKKALTNEGMVRGLNLLLQELYQSASNNGN